jgi:hypothetical protein
VRPTPRGRDEAFAAAFLVAADGIPMGRATDTDARQADGLEPALIAAEVRVEAGVHDAVLGAVDVARNGIPDETIRVDEVRGPAVASMMYIAGMFLNDAFDREIDRIERPPASRCSAAASRGRRRRARRRCGLEECSRRLCSPR